MYTVCSYQYSFYCVGSGPVVTALYVQYGILYAGITGGYLITIDALTMTTLNVLNCHGDQSPFIRAILPLVATRNSVSCHRSNNDKLGVVTVGRGYHDVLSEHLGLSQVHEIRCQGQFYAMTWHGQEWQFTPECEAACQTL